MTAAARLKAALGALTDGALQRLASAHGVPWLVAARARAGREVNACDYLALCCAAGIDAQTGAAKAWKQKPGPVLWWFLGAAVLLHRMSEGLTQADAARAAGVTITTLSRIESAIAVGTENFLAVCRFLAQPPESFTGNHCNTLTRKEAA